MRALSLLVMLAACKNEPYAEQAPPPKVPDVVVGLASTRLGADCPDGRYSPPLAKPATSKKGATTEGEAEGERIPCDQTAVHLSVRAAATATPTKMTVKRVELLDKNGALIEELKANSPSRWGTDSFVAWDESIAPGQALSVGYKLKSPDWSKIPNPNKRSFRMRITVTVGDREQTFEATAELRIEDTSNVVT